MCLKIFIYLIKTHLYFLIIFKVQYILYFNMTFMYMSYPRHNLLNEHQFDKIQMHILFSITYLEI